VAAGFPITSRPTTPWLLLPRKYYVRGQYGGCETTLVTCLWFRSFQTSAYVTNTPASADGALIIANIEQALFLTLREMLGLPVIRVAIPTRPVRAAPDLTDTQAYPSLG
jgi:hypothetical protein